MAICAAYALLFPSSHVGAAPPDMSAAEHATSANIAENVIAETITHTDNENTTLAAHSVSASVDGSYDITGDGPRPLDQTKLTALNTAIDQAADDYAALLNNYGNYSDHTAYMQALEKISTSIKNYDDLAAQIKATAIKGDTGAQNHIHVENENSSSSWSHINQVNAVIGNYNNLYHNYSPVQQNILSGTNIITAAKAAGITAQNNAFNNANITDTSSDGNTAINVLNNFSIDKTNIIGSDDHIVTLGEAYAIDADTGSKNKIETNADIIVKGDFSSTGTQKLQNEHSMLHDSDLWSVAGISADNGALNNVKAHNITAELDGYTGSVRFEADAPSTDLHMDSKIYITNIENACGVVSDNGAHNIVDTGNYDIKANIGGDYYNSICDGANKVTSGTAKISKINLTDIELFGVAASDNGINEVKTNNIEAKSNSWISIDDKYESGIERDNFFNAAVTAAGVYADSGARNIIQAKGSISAKLDTVNYVSYGTNLNVAPSEKINYTTSFNASGVSGSGYGFNQISADSIEASAAVDSTVNDLPDRLIYAASINSKGVSAIDNAINDINVNEIEADSSFLDMPTRNNNNDIIDYEAGSGIYQTAMGAYADTKAVNDLHVGQINVNNQLSDQNELTSPIATYTDVYGIYGAGHSITNLHSKQADGTVNIMTDLNNFNTSISYDTAKIHNYSIYFNNAELNLYDNVKAYKDTDDESTMPLTTYLKDAAVNFAGYNDYYSYYDPYSFDSEHKTYERNILGSGVFHTYASDTGTLNLQGSDKFTVNTDLKNNKSDKMTFAKLDNTSTGEHFVSVASDPSVKLDAVGTIYGRTAVIKIADADNKLTAADGNKFDFDSPALSQQNSVSFTGKTFFKEDALRKYYLTPTVETETDRNGSKNVVITRLDYNTLNPSNPLQTASDAQVSLRNAGLLEPAEDSTLMQRMGELRTADPHDDGLWVRFNKGRLHADGAFGSNIRQNYNQIFLGYDKKTDTKKGKMYTGAAISHVDSSSSYEYGSGKVKSNVLSLYSTYFTDNGHYLDLIARAEQLKNDFNSYTASGQKVHADYTTPGYLLSAEYGYRKEMKNGAFLQPQVQLSAGRIQGATFHMSNGTTVDQSAINSMIGRVGILAGKQYDNGSNIYFDALLYHEFGGAGDITGYHDTDSKNMPGEDYGTWYGIGIGGNIKMSKNSNMYMDISKSFGGSVQKDYQVNFGMRWDF